MVWPGIFFVGGGGLIMCLHRVGLTRVSHKFSIPKLGFGYFLKINATGVGIYRTIHCSQQQNSVIVVHKIFLAKYGLELNGL